MDEGPIDLSELRRLDRPLFSRMGRRRFLRTLLNVGFGAGVAAALTPDDFLKADEGEMPIIYGHTHTDQPWSLTPRTKTVPVRWYNELQRVFEIQETLAASGIPGLVGTFAVPGDFSDPEATLSIDVTAEADLPSVEEYVQDINSVIQVIEPLDPMWGEDPVDAVTNRIEQLHGDGVPAGVVCSSPTIPGSLAPAMYDAANEERFFTTSNHLYGHEGGLRTEHRNEPLFLLEEDSRKRIGRVRQGFPKDDFVRADPVDGYQPSSRIEGASPSRVTGQFTKMGLADLYARDEPLEKIGGRSGHTSGQIKGINGLTCYYGPGCKRHQLKWGDETAMTDGDSGSVSYHVDPKNPEKHLLIGGFNNARTWWPTGDFTWGTAAYDIYQTHGYHF
jgi:hypothetical protein